MKIFSRKRNIPETRASGLENFVAADGNPVHVTEDTALNLSAVWRCVRLSSETLSTVPLRVYEKVDGGGRLVALNHPLYELLHDQPNPIMNSQSFRDYMQSCYELYGEALAQIVLDGRGEVVELWPIPPSTVKVETAAGELVYIVKKAGKILKGDSVLRILGHTDDGVKAVRPIQKAKESMAVGLASQRFGGKFYANGTNVGGILKAPGNLSDEAFERLKEQFNVQYAGLGNSSKPLLLEEGMSYEKVGVSPDDAQFLETRKFQTVEVARWFGIPPTLVYDLSASTYNNQEAQSIDAVKYSWRPRAVRWEQAINSSLLKSSDKGRFYVEFDLNGLLRGDTKTRFESYRIGLQDGWLNADEVREKENMNPMPEGLGSVYMVPLNFQNREGMIAMSDQPDPERSSGEDPEKRVADPVMELRKRQDVSVSNRKLIAAKMRPEIKKAVDKILKEDIKVLRGLLDSAAGDITALNQKIKDTYKDEISSIARDKIAPVIELYAKKISPVIKAEIGEFNEDDYAKFISDYIENFGARYSISSYTQIRAISKAADGDISGKIDERIDYWEATRSDVVVKEETVRGQDALSKAAYIAGGITALRWITNGESCPYCNALNGKVVGISDSFLKKGESFEPDGATNGPINPSSNIGHAPAHAGCDCAVVAEVML